MSKRALTDELFNRLIDAYRDAPGNASHASAVAGCDRRTAKNAYDRGWPKKAFAQTPIREILRREQEELRARRMEDERKRREAEFAAREQSRQDALATTVEEARAIASTRRNAIATGAAISKVLTGLIPATEKLRAWLEAKEGGPNPREIPKIIRDIASSQRMVAENLRISMELERLRAGNPNDVIADPLNAEVTTELAVEQLSRLERTLRRAQAQGHFGDAESLPDTAYIDDPDDDGFGGFGGESGIH